MIAINESIETISFPEAEYKAIQERINNGKENSTTRVAYEFGKYKLNSIYKTPWEDYIIITKVQELYKIQEHPHYDYLTEGQRNEIFEYSEKLNKPYEFIKFKKYIMENINIKIVEKNDLDNLFELNILFKNNTTKKDMEIIFNQNNKEIICIAYFENIAVGYCTGLIIESICYKNKRMDIETLFVKEEYRQKGIGKKLIQFIEKEALLRNINHFHINTNTNNCITIKFYEKMNYKNTGELLLDKTINKE